jgi:caa(3)-type oxidase subunit IV
VWVAEADLGHWHTPIALTIAAFKATLIVLFFMHALESSKLTWIVIGGAILWLAILLAGTFSDYWTRKLDYQIRNPTAEQQKGRATGDVRYRLLPPCSAVRLLVFAFLLGDQP